MRIAELHSNKNFQFLNHKFQKVIYIFIILDTYSSNTIFYSTRYNKKIDAPTRSCPMEINSGGYEDYILNRK